MADGDAFYKWGTRVMNTLAAYGLAVFINIVPHMTNRFWAESKLESDTITEIQKDQLRTYRSECLRESPSRDNLWGLIPGSYFWRAPERPVIED